jgi:hypothetical protein
MAEFDAVVPHTPFVPAKAGTQSGAFRLAHVVLGPRFRGDERCPIQRFTFEILVGTPNSRWQTSASVAMP